MFKKRDVLVLLLLSLASLIMVNVRGNMGRRTDRSTATKGDTTNQPTTPEDPILIKRRVFDQMKANFRIVYLIVPAEEDNLVLSLQLLCQNFLAKNHPYPVIFFHDPKYTPDRLQGLQNKIQEKVAKTCPMLKTVFQEVEWKLPATYDQTKDPPKVWLQDFPGYHLMIRFWFKQVFSLPILADSRYYLRLDTDSFIQSPLEEDPFWTMYENGYTYAWRAIDVEKAFVTVGMAEFMTKYNASHVTNSVTNGLELPQREHWDYYEPPMMYNNFEIVDLQRFRAKDMLDFVAAVDATNYILTRRWGDAPLRYFQAMMILDWKREVWNIKSFDYLHGHHNKFMAKGSNVIEKR